MAKQETKAAVLASYIESVRKSLPELRNFYLDEAAQEKNRKEAGKAAWDVGDPEQYLKRLYNATTAFALRNGLYGRAEFYSDEVKEVMSKDHRFAKLWIPQNFTPIVDALRHKVFSKLFGPMRRPDQEEFSKATFEAMIQDTDIRSLIYFPVEDGDGDDVENGMNALRFEWGERNFKRVEEIGYATVARMAVFTQINALVESGWIWPFMGMGDSKLEGVFPVLAAVHVINGRASTDGVKGRALVHALLGFFGTKGAGLFAGYGIPEELWDEVDMDRWCEGAGFMSEGLAGYWGMGVSMPERPEDAAPRPPAEMTPEAAAMMKMLADAMGLNGKEAEKAKQTEPKSDQAEKAAAPAKAQKPAASKSAEARNPEATRQIIEVESKVFEAAVSAGSNFHEIHSNGDDFDVNAEGLREAMASPYWRGSVASVEAYATGSKWTLGESGRKFEFDAPPLNTLAVAAIASSTPAKKKPAKAALPKTVVDDKPKSGLPPAKAKAAKAGEAVAAERKATAKKASTKVPANSTAKNTEPSQKNATEPVPEKAMDTNASTEAHPSAKP